MTLQYICVAQTGGDAMIAHRLASQLIGVTALAVITPVTALADAPKQLLNKTIFLSWSIQTSQKAQDGRIVTPTVSIQHTTYVSTAGRLFARVTRDASNRNFRASKTGEASPGQKQGYAGLPFELRFQGNTLIGTQSFASGAAHIQVRFDSGFSSCSLEVVYGKSGGGPIRWKAVDGAMYEVLSVTPSGQSCSIRDGNAFAS